MSPFPLEAIERYVMPKLSRFNHVLPWREGNFLAFNAITGALGVLTSEKYDVYQRLVAKLTNESSKNLDQEEQELLGHLQYGHFVVDKDQPEMDWLKFRYRKSRYDSTSLGLIVAPTMACNMACPYCFEGNKRGRMSPRIVESLIAFVEKQAGDLKDVSITWYGGEPLLAFDVIEDITESMLELAGEYKFSYECTGMITNGYLLDNKTVDRIVEMNMGEVQVTIDGPARVHDIKRPLKNGQGSFDTILANLQYAADKIPVVVRVNLDKDFTSDHVLELLGELERGGLRDKLAIYFGRLEPATPACSNISESCYEAKAYSETEIEYFRLLLERGFGIQRLPQPIMTFCFAQLENSFLIDPDGDMYRCFNYAGDKSRSMGNIQDELNLQNAEFNRLFAFDPFENEACRSCEILPICMGSCPSRRLDREVPEDEVCDSWKFNLEPMLELVALSRQQQARQSAEQAAQETSK